MKHRVNLTILALSAALLVGCGGDDAAEAPAEAADPGPETATELTADLPEPPVGDSAEEPDAGQPDDGPDVHEPDAVAPPAGPQLCGPGTPRPPPAPVGTSPGAVGPFEPGDSADVLLGALDDPTALVPTTAPLSPDYTMNLAAATVDVHVPPTYDGDTPFGLIVFINAGNSGGAPPKHLAPLLEQHNLLWAAPDGVGNPIFSVIRLGWTHMTALRMAELYNVDPARIYVMGKSGGARHANLLAFQHPETYAAVLAWCGAHYFRPVEQAYETQEPDSHYEFWAPDFIPTVPGSFAEHLAAFGQRFSLMTSVADFREGDLMNIYHFGYLADGLPVRFLDTAGGHCSMDAAHMRSGLGFAEHPLHLVVDDAFDDAGGATGDGWIALAGDPKTGNGLTLAGPAAVLAANRIVWQDRHGVTLRARIDLTTGPGRAVIGLWPVSDAHGGESPTVGFELEDGATGLHVAVERTASGANTVAVRVGPGGDALEVLTAELSDWDSSADSIDVSLDLWDHAIQLTLDRHLAAGETVAPGAAVMVDRKTLVAPWPAMGVDWTAAGWPALPGTALTLGATGGTARFEHVRVIDGVGLSCDAPRSD